MDKQCVCCKLPYKTSDHGRAGNQDLHVARVSRDLAGIPGAERGHRRLAAVSFHLL